MRLFLSTVITILITAPLLASAAMLPAPPENNVIVYGKVFYEDGDSANGCRYAIQAYSGDILISERTGLAGTGYVEQNMIYESGNMVNGVGDKFLVTLTSPDGSQIGKWEHILTEEEKHKNIVQMPDLILYINDEGIISRWSTGIRSYLSQFKRLLAGFAIMGGAK